MKKFISVCRAVPNQKYVFFMKCLQFFSLNWKYEATVLEIYNGKHFYHRTDA